MRIRYVDGPRFFRAFRAGAEALIGARDAIDRINVFPVADADTGTNMVATVRAVLLNTTVSPSLNSTAVSMAAAAVDGARGNSGLIFAQYLYGLARELETQARIAGGALGEPLVRAARWAREAVGHPVEGTILTVIRDWAEAVRSCQRQLPDLAELLPETLKMAQQSLARTPRQLAVLAKAGVVDAGAKGFVTFLEGVTGLIQSGSRSLRAATRLPDAPAAVGHPSLDPDGPRFCTEAMVTGGMIEAGELRRLVEGMGTSVVVAGGKGALHVHVHTDDPPALFDLLERDGRIEAPKVDDMRRQYQAAHGSPAEVALVTDSTCDLPRDLLDEHRAHVVPIPLEIDGSSHLDRLTITAETFYERQARSHEAPTTSQPPAAEFERVFRYLHDARRRILAIPLSSRLSGTCNAARMAAHRVGDVRVVDSRRISAALGLLVLRASRAIHSGVELGEIARAVSLWIPKTIFLAVPRNLDTLWKSGRLHGAKGFAARFFGAIPVITFDDSGSLVRAGVARLQAGALATAAERLAELSAGKKIWGWAVVHANAPEAASAWAAELRSVLGQPPLFVGDAAPALGLHAGPGTLAVAVMLR